MTKSKTTMSDEARAERNAYKREWQRANPDKVKEQQRRYWQRKADAKRAAIAEAQDAGELDD